jgi:Na+/proline symporter
MIPLALLSNVVAQLPTEAVPTLGGGFSVIDWLVVLGVLVVITILGERLAGKQESVRDFYLGGRRLPWYAVSASIIATGISAVTFFVVPSMVWRPGGTLLYLQVGVFSALVARLIVAFVLVPAYYEREVYSPYEYMGNRLGAGVRKLTTALFMIGGLLAQASRVYITAVIIEVLAKEELDAVAAMTGLTPIASAIGAIALVALLWTWLGGVATVIWTDAFLFLMFLAGLVGMLFVLHAGADGGLMASIDIARETGRLTFIDTDFAFSKPYTLVAVIFAISWGFVGPFGTDQLIVQRLLCCKDERDAKKAMIGSYLSVVVIGLAFLVGIGLLGYYATHSMSEVGAALTADGAKPERILAVFVREELPVGVRGLVLAAAFAAAISSLDSILAALGQTTLATLWTPWRERGRNQAFRDEQEEARASLRASRVIVALWTVVLAAAAVGMQAIEARYDNLLNLALAMSSLIGGPLLAGFALSWLPQPAGLGDARHARGSAGFMWAAPLGVLTVLFAIWHGPVAYVASWWAISAVFALWLVTGLPRRSQPYGAVQTLLYGFSLFLVTRLAEVGDFDDGKSIAWSWYVPVGSTVTFLYALLLDKHGRSR